MNIIDLLISTIQFFPQWGGQVAIGTALSLFVTEVVRDGYHSLHHIVPFLYHRFHRWHHEPYGDGFEDKDHEAFRRGLRRFDIPESCAMAIANLGLLKVCVAVSPGLALGVALGNLRTLRLLGVRVLRLFNVQWAIEADVNHQPGLSPNPPGRWRVNLSYHWRHHFHDEMAYFSGIMTCLDQLLGTAISLKSRRVAFVGQSGRLGQPLRRRLTQSGAMVMLPADAQVSASFEETDLLILSVLVPQQNLYSLIGELEYFVSTVRTNRDIALKEVWVLLPSSELAPAAGIKCQLLWRVASIKLAG